MRVLLLSEGALGPGMLGHQTVAMALRKRLEMVPDLNVSSCILPTMGRVSERLATRAGPMQRIDPDLQRARWHAVQAVRVRRLLRAELSNAPVDVLHVHTHSIALGLLDILRRIPTLVSVDATILQHRAMGSRALGTDTSGPSLRAMLTLERRVFARAHTVLAWSEWAARGVYASCPNANVVVHDPGFDLERFRPVEQRSVRERPRVLFVGANFREKGGYDLLTALSPFLGVAVDLDVVTTSKLEAGEGVRIHRVDPEANRLVELHQQADIFCLPTYQDCSPWALREAMACGAAVVSTPMGAIPDFLNSGQAGRLVASHDPQALGQVLIELLDSEETRLRLGAAARKRCEHLWDACRQTALLADLIRLAGVSAH